ncbi:Ferric/cupric reductase transmembrane component [Lachnellula willkommii]|uniref:ferric-chelate reductase (NADPH) n=1 Tax=Lachnellula willkommii TaxID=215461 RepID=A0A559MCV2_9HELO|nr:Ferric/cupric reductase transmembrane component [Lachnellula willkommii]
MSSTATDTSPTALSTVGLDMTNETVKMDFLTQLLDDTVLQVTSNHYATIFWYGIVVVIVLAAIFKFVLRMMARSRLRGAAAAKPMPNTPSCIAQIAGTTSTYIRKITYPQISPRHHPSLFHLPPFGIFILLFVYLLFILLLEFIKQDIPGDQHSEAIGIRAGWLTITQLPLLILLSGKINLIGLITGVSYERLNILHRWVARIMLLTATIHMGVQQGLWNHLGLLTLEWNTDDCPPTGIQAYAFLLWMNLTTLFPLRNYWYELFVLQHILTFFGFIISIMLHLPDTALYTRIYVFIPIGLYILDRILRTARYAWNNINPGRATLTRCEGGVVKIVVKSRGVRRWRPGSFVLLGMPRFGVGQSHPVTISSVPASHDGELVFILKAHDGFTRRVFDAARTGVVPLNAETSGEGEIRDGKDTHLALIDGPYGGTQLDLASFSTVVLIAGSAGVSFTLPILLDIAERTKSVKLPVREVVFVWTLKTRGCILWVEEELRSASEALGNFGIGITVKVFVTGNGEFGEESEGRESSVEISKPHPVISEQDEEVKVELAVNGNEEGARGDEKRKDTPPSHRAESPNTTLQSGRPDIQAILAEAQSRANGEMGVAVCGPVGLAASTRNSVARLEGKGVGIYLHAESFGW